MIPVDAPAPDRVLLERILSSPDLARAGEREGELGALLRRLSSLLGDWLGASGAATVSRIVVLGVVAVVAALALAWVLRRLSPRLRTVAPGAAAAPKRLDAPARHLADAEAARARGDLRAAIRHELLAVLSRLEDARLVGYGRHKTNLEYARDLGHRGAPAGVALAFEAYVGEYDARFYGRRALAEADLERLSGARRRVFDAVEEAAS